MLLDGPGRRQRLEQSLPPPKRFWTETGTPNLIRGRAVRVLRSDAIRGPGTIRKPDPWRQDEDICACHSMRDSDDVPASTPDRVAASREQEFLVLEQYR